MAQYLQKTQPVGKDVLAEYAQRKPSGEGGSREGGLATYQVVVCKQVIGKTGDIWCWWGETQETKAGLDGGDRIVNLALEGS